jgi:PAS domain S-box-containing protein
MLAPGKCNEELRKLAEQKMAQFTENAEALSPGEAQRNLHELRVHQIELEMQNEDLRNSQTELEAVRARYFSLYDLAPVGYFTINEQRLILESNLSAAVLLGESRGSLVGKTLAQFIFKEDQDLYYLQCKQLFKSGEMQTFDLRMLKKDGSAFWGHLRIAVAHPVDGVAACSVVLSDISERKQMEHELLKSEKRYRRITEEITDYVYTVIVRNGRAVETRHGPACEAVTGYTAQDFAEAPLLWIATVPLEDRKRVIEHFKIILAGGKLPAIEHRIIRKDGQIRWVSDKSVLHFDSNNVLLSYEGIIRDITEINQANEALRESEARYRNIFEGIPDGVIVHDGDGVILDANEAMVQRLELPLDAILGRKIAEFISPDNMSAIRNNAANALRGALLVFETIYVSASGRMTPAEVYEHQIPWKGMSAVLSISRDITKRKQMYEALQLNTARHHTILQTAMDGFWLADKKGRLLEVNDAYCRMSGYSMPELLTMHIPELEDEETSDETDAHILKVMREGEARFESRHRRKDGTVFSVEVSVQYRPEEGGRFVAFVQDITGRKKSEAKLASTYKELEQVHNKLLLARQSEKLAFTGRIAASIAHEIRNPSTTISLALGQLSSISQHHEKQDRYIGIIEKNINRINYLITEMLSCARPAELNMELNDIHEILDGVVETVEMKMSTHKIRLVREFTAADSVLNVDKEQINRVFLNLIVNAIDAMAKKGGILTIATDNNGEYFVIEVKDTGKGISQDNIIKIFDPFFTTKTSGIGLGLTTCYGVVASHGGTIEVASKISQGTAFAVSLPVRR